MAECRGPAVVDDGQFLMAAVRALNPCGAPVRALVFEALRIGDWGAKYQNVACSGAAAWGAQSYTSPLC